MESFQTAWEWEDLSAWDGDEDSPRLHPHLRGREPPCRHGGVGLVAALADLRGLFQP